GVRTHVVTPQEDCENGSGGDKSVDHALTQRPVEGTSLSTSEASSSHTVSSVQRISQTPQSSQSDEFAHLFSDSQLAEALDVPSPSSQSINPDPYFVELPVTATATTTEVTPTPASTIPSTISTVLATSQSEGSITYDPHTTVNDTEMANVGTTEGSKTRRVIQSHVSGSHSFDPYNRGDGADEFVIVGRNGRRLRSSTVSAETGSDGRPGLHPTFDDPAPAPSTNRKKAKKSRKKQMQLDTAPQLVLVQ
ncbi:hypothetical protein EC968_008839, partial [Mortierella alpina]